MKGSTGGKRWFSLVANLDTGCFMLFLSQEGCNPDQSEGLMFTVRGEGYLDAVAGLTKERR